MASSEDETERRDIPRNILDGEEGDRGSEEREHRRNKWHGTVEHQDPPGVLVV